MKIALLFHLIGLLLLVGTITRRCHTRSLATPDIDAPQSARRVTFPQFRGPSNLTSRDRDAKNRADVVDFGPPDFNPPAVLAGSPAPESERQPGSRGA